jgi:DNA-3-methyladenine glycosylase I
MKTKNDTLVNRCDWCLVSPIMTAYHDEEWGVPVHDDKKHFEFLVLDAFQAGLSWHTILKKREAFRRAFSNFDFNLVATYDNQAVEQLMQNKGIVRNRLKIESTITNAKAFLNIINEFSSFDTYIWSFTNHQTLHNQYASMKEIPAQSPEAKKMSKDLKKRGFRFVGPTICYAYMQAAGMVNDHITSCFKHTK